jgi:hypothetical protein
MGATSVRHRILALGLAFASCMASADTRVFRLPFEGRDGRIASDVYLKIEYLPANIPLGADARPAAQSDAVQTAKALLLAVRDGNVAAATPLIEPRAIPPGYKGIDEYVEAFRGALQRMDATVIDGHIPLGSTAIVVLRSSGAKRGFRALTFRKNPGGRFLFDERIRGDVIELALNSIFLGLSSLDLEVRSVPATGYTRVPMTSGGSNGNVDFFVKATPLGRRLSDMGADSAKPAMDYYRSCHGQDAEQAKSAYFACFDDDTRARLLASIQKLPAAQRDDVMKVGIASTKIIDYVIDAGSAIYIAFSIDGKSGRGFDIVERQAKGRWILRSPLLQTSFGEVLADPVLADATRKALKGAAR